MLALAVWGYSCCIMHITSLEKLLLGANLLKDLTNESVDKPQKSTPTIRNSHLAQV